MILTNVLFQFNIETTPPVANMWRTDIPLGQEQTSVIVIYPLTMEEFINATIHFSLQTLLSNIHIIL